MKQPLTGKQYEYITELGYRNAYTVFDRMPTLLEMSEWIIIEEKRLNKMKKRCVDVNNQQKANAKLEGSNE